MISIYLGEVWPIQSADGGLRFHILIITQNLSIVNPCSSQEGREEATAEAPTCACIVCGFNTGALEKMDHLMCSFWVGWWTLNHWCRMQQMHQYLAARPEHLQVLANSMDNIQGIDISTGLLIAYIYIYILCIIFHYRREKQLSKFQSILFDDIWYISCTGVECSVLHQVAAFVGGKAMSAWPVSDVALAVRLYIVI